MTAGFQSINDNGDYQIDGENLTFVLDRKVSGRTVYTGYGNSLASIEYNDGEIVALRSDSYVSIDSLGNGEMVITGTPNANGGRGTSSDAINFTAYVFSQKPSNPSSGTGLQVFDADGNSVYYSGDKNLNIVDIVSGHQSFTYDLSRTYAMIINNVKFVGESGSGGVQGTIISYVNRQMSYVHSISGGIQSVYVPDWSWTTVNGPAPPDANCSSPSFNGIVIDVTGF